MRNDLQYFRRLLKFNLQFYFHCSRTSHSDCLGSEDFAVCVNLGEILEHFRPPSTDKVVSFSSMTVHSSKTITKGFADSVISFIHQRAENLWNIFKIKMRKTQPTHKYTGAESFSDTTAVTQAGSLHAMLL